MFCGGLFMFGLGSVFTLMGLYFLKQAILLRRRGTPTVAKVVGRDEEGEVSDVKFRDLSGTLRRAKVGGCLPIGSPMPILYDRDHPSRAISGPLAEVWGFAVAFMGLGLLALMTGVGIWTGVITVN